MKTTITLAYPAPKDVRSVLLITLVLSFLFLIAANIGLAPFAGWHWFICFMPLYMGIGVCYAVICLRLLIHMLVYVFKSCFYE